MACDECAQMRAELNDARLQLRHLEEVIAARRARRDDTELMNKMLHLEVTRLQNEVRNQSLEGEAHHND